VGEESGKRVGRLFSAFGAPIVQTTPVQAERAKIWTNILRYTQFALPNLLMMDCERHDANVFEVIDLVNRDYPRGGIAQPGLTGGTCLRKNFAFSEERSNRLSATELAPAPSSRIPRCVPAGPRGPGRIRDRPCRPARRPRRGHRRDHRRPRAPL
jgi:UDP-N-acetyl-D-mannosaminuronic acid dehydrogenase